VPPEEQAEFIHNWLETLREAINQGWVKEEATAGISLLDSYLMLPSEPEWMGPELQKWNVFRLYDLLSNSRFRVLKNNPATRAVSI
jgi:hypothetical protein